MKYYRPLVFSPVAMTTTLPGDSCQGHQCHQWRRWCSLVQWVCHTWSTAHETSSQGSYVYFTYHTQATMTSQTNTREEH